MLSTVEVNFFLLNRKTSLNRPFFTNLLSLKITFLFFSNKEDILFFSEPIEREDLFFSIYFILLLRYPVLIPDGAEKLKILISDVNSNLKSVSDKIGRLPPAIADTNQDGPSRNTRSQTSGSCAGFSSLELYRFYMEASDIIFGNENVRVAKFMHNSKQYAIKCCEILKSPQHANAELKNEAIMFKQITQINGKIFCFIFISNTIFFQISYYLLEFFVKIQIEIYFDFTLNFEII